MPRHLRQHLRRGGAAQGVARVQRAAQAQHGVHVFFNRGIEGLQPLNLDLSSLVIFDTILSERNIPRAAERLALAQPTVRT